MTRDSDFRRFSDDSPNKNGPGKVYLTANQVRRRYGGITSMTLHRWLKRKKMRFPKPSYFNRLRYWELSELEAWERAGKPAPDFDIEGGDDVERRAATTA